ncbi:hypothetical protein BD779DRAFT_1790556 [Infundibulicybe gibba]|nr:hypothetical protein BD779DRAFT_1790556 [Infundibulicybe gibba]
MHYHQRARNTTAVHVGLAIGFGIFLLLVAGGVYFCCRRKRDRARAAHAAITTAPLSTTKGPFNLGLKGARLSQESHADMAQAKGGAIAPASVPNSDLAANKV